MARYIGPVCKLCRREGMKLLLKGDRCLSPKCAIERRNTPPGPVSQKRARKTSEFGLQLREKQKAKRIYGVLERQFRRHFDEANRQQGVTGENLLRILEMRLDNVVYRLGFADSRAQARQLVRHGHFSVNGIKTNIPSFIVKQADAVVLRDTSRELDYFKAVGQSLGKHSAPRWLSLDARTLGGSVISVPTKDDIDLTINDQLIVEFYSR